MKLRKLYKESYMLLYAFMFVINLILMCRFSEAEIMPTVNMIEWRGNVGVTGGIPFRNIKRNCVTLDGAVGDGITDSTTAIRNCISNSPNGTVAYLPQGTYIVSDSIFMASNKTLRGDGPDKTVLLFQDTQNYNINFGRDFNFDLLKKSSVTSGYIKGSTQLVVGDGRIFSVGGYMGIDALNDNALGVTQNGVEGACTWCGIEYGGTRARNQVFKITNIAENTLTIDPPLVYTFNDVDLPRAINFIPMIINAGLEDITVENNGGGVLKFRENIYLFGAVDSWIKNVNIKNCGVRCIEDRYFNYRVEIRDNKISGCIDHLNSNRCYGTALGGMVSSNLIENNIYTNVSQGPIVMNGASANVIAYNYCDNVHRSNKDTSFYMSDTWSHGSHTAYNLWEGNEVVGIHMDFIHGSASHNVFFRNRVLSKSQGITYDPSVQMISAILFDQFNRNMAVVGNVLGTPLWNKVYEHSGESFKSTDKMIYKLGYASNGDSTGVGIDPLVKLTLYRHGNYDYVTNFVIWDPGNSDHTLPSSLYLSKKPIWWCTETPWPPIGADLSPMTSDIPSKRRFNGENCKRLNTPMTPIILRIN